MAGEEAQDHIDDADNLHHEDDVQVVDAVQLVRVDVLEKVHRREDESAQKHEHNEALPGECEARERMDGPRVDCQVELPLVDYGRVAVEVLECQAGGRIDGRPLDDCLRPRARM